ncbi:MAG: serine hydrolase [Legionellaceae bacterium]|nr:serine hydrolase [Legionellaceae bacterium]
MKHKAKLTLFLNTFLFTQVLFAGCGQADMNQAINQLMSEAKTLYKVPGIQISITCPGKSTPHDFVSGYADVQKRRSMRPEHLFQVGSETKAFIAAILLQLESEGKLSLNDSIAHYLNDLPVSWQSVTINQILNHTSGIPDYLSSPQFLSKIKTSNSSKQWTYEELINLVRATKRVFQPGRAWDYSQTNYVLAGKIIEIVTQNSLEYELNHRIFGPLKLKNTLYVPHAYNNALLQRMAHGYSEYGLFPNEPKDITTYNISWLNAAGSMLSTTHDKAIWWKALFAADILPPLQKQKLKHLVDIESGQFLPPKSPRYGYGLGILGWYDSPVGPVWGAVGKTLGYYTGTFYLECNDIIISISCNHYGKAESEGPGIRLLIFKLVNTIKSFDTKQCSKMGTVNEASKFPSFLKILDNELIQ